MAWSSALACSLATIYALTLHRSYRMLNDRLPQFIRDNYECHEWKHASAILTQDFPSEWQDLLDILSGG